MSVMHLIFRVGATREADKICPLRTSSLTKTKEINGVRG